MALPDLGYGEGARVEPQGVLGVYGAEPLARRMGRSWRRWQAEGEVSFDLTRMGYRVVRPAGEPGYADLGYATYYHATGLASLVYAWGRVRFGPGFGGGWGSPLVRGDRDVGSFNPFVAGVFLLRLRLAGDTWLEGSTAFRYLEKRYTFPTDFAGDPVPEPERRFVWLFLGGKVRFGP